MICVSKGHHKHVTFRCCISIGPLSAWCCCHWSKSNQLRYIMTCFSTESSDSSIFELKEILNKHPVIIHASKPAGMLSYLIWLFLLIELTKILAHKTLHWIVNRIPWKCVSRLDAIDNESELFRIVSWCLWTLWQQATACTSDQDMVPCPEAAFVSQAVDESNCVWLPVW